MCFKYPKCVNKITSNKYSTVYNAKLIIIKKYLLFHNKTYFFTNFIKSFYSELIFS